MNMRNTFVALSTVAALAPLSVACSSTSDPQSEAVASTEQALSLTTSEIAFQANTGNLSGYGSQYAGDTGKGMLNGTNPSITALDGGSYEMAYQDNTGYLEVVGSNKQIKTNFLMVSNTSPSIAGLSGGGYEVAVQGTDGHLWLYGTAYIGSTPYVLRSSSSPSIAALTGGGYEVAVQGLDGQLWLYGAAYQGPTGVYMTGSPSITGLPGGGYEVAVQGNDGHLWLYGTANKGSTSSVLMPGTNPSITALTGGGYEVALQGLDSGLWLYGTQTNGGTTNKLMSGTSPSITGLAGGGYEVALEGLDGYLWVYGTQTSGSTGKGMMKFRVAESTGTVTLGTSPSISPIFPKPTGLTATTFIDPNYGGTPNAAITVSWNQVPGASSYLLFGGYMNGQYFYMDQGKGRKATGPSYTYSHSSGDVISYSTQYLFNVAACYPSGLCGLYSDQIQITSASDPNKVPPPPPTTGGISVYYELHAPAPYAICGTATFVLDNVVYEYQAGYWQQLSENQQPYSAAGWCQYNWGFSLVKPGAHQVCAYVGDPSTKSCASKSVSAGSTVEARING